MDFPLGISMPSGVFINYESILCGEPQPILLSDIMWNLRSEPRFNGGTLKPYSVLQHLLVTHAIVRRLGGSPTPASAGALLHDAHEAYNKDLPQPVKALLRRYTDVYDLLSNGLQEQILTKFGIVLDDDDEHLIHRADAIALHYESRVLLHPASYALMKQKYGWEDDEHNYTCGFVERALALSCDGQLDAMARSCELEGIRDS